MTTLERNNSHKFNLVDDPIKRHKLILLTAAGVLFISIFILNHHPLSFFQKEYDYRRFLIVTVLIYVCAMLLSDLITLHFNLENKVLFIIKRLLIITGSIYNTYILLVYGDQIMDSTNPIYLNGIPTSTYYMAIPTLINNKIELIVFMISLCSFWIYCFLQVISFLKQGELVMELADQYSSNGITGVVIMIFRKVIAGGNAPD